MITLTRLGAGLPIAINPDLIQRIEETPDTVITLIDGHKLVVEQPLDLVVSMVRTWRAMVAAEAIQIVRQADVEDDEPVTEEQSFEAAIAEKGAGATPGALVLQMPHREV